MQQSSVSLAGESSPVTWECDCLAHDHLPGLVHHREQPCPPALALLRAAHGLGAHTPRDQRRSSTDSASAASCAHSRDSRAPTARSSASASRALTTRQITDPPARTAPGDRIPATHRAGRQRQHCGHRIQPPLIPRPSQTSPVRPAGPTTPAAIPPPAALVQTRHLRTERGQQVLQNGRLDQ